MRSFALACVLFLACCGGDDDDSPTPQQACLDTADAFGDLCVRCNADTYANCHDAIVQAVNGDCSNTAAIRDEAELYGQCIPYFQTVACAVVNDPNWAIDSSCQGQLQHR